MTSWWCEKAYVQRLVQPGIRIEAKDGVITLVESAAPRPEDVRLPGLVLPGFANAHSHAFHRALRGRTQHDTGSFWTWREAMYDLAGRLDPDRYLALARATYAEMALAGVTSVGEFHYLHHGPTGTPYDDPNAMGEALREAAREAGVRLTLLDACYLRGGLSRDGHLPLAGVQRRFGDRDVEAWARRVEVLKGDAGTRIGVAAHSVRAVPREALPTIAAWDGPRHVHLSEQPAENEACLGFYGLTPTALLDEAGFLGPHATAVHASHLSAHDITTLGTTGTRICLCPTTERDLGDGVGAAWDLLQAGAFFTVGTDQHVSMDLFEEVRGIEHHARLASLQRGRFRPEQLLDALTAHGQRSLGWGSGDLRVGEHADLVAVRMDSPRTAGSRAEQAIYAATAADVTDVVIDGKVVVSRGQHVLGDVGRLLTDAIATAWA